MIFFKSQRNNLFDDLSKTTPGNIYNVKNEASKYSLYFPDRLQSRCISLELISLGVNAFQSESCFNQEHTQTTPTTHIYTHVYDNTTHTLTYMTIPNTDVNNNGIKKL